MQVTRQHVTQGSVARLWLIIFVHFIVSITMNYPDMFAVLASFHVEF